MTPPTPSTSREGDEQESETEPEDGSPEGAAQAPAEVDVPALREKAAKADEYLDLAQRTRAEFENYRKRAVREAAGAQERGAAKLALALLPALDNLDRALAHADQSSEPASGAEATGAEATGGAADGGAADTGPAVDGAASFVSGIRHVQADVLAALGKLGIEAYSPEGEPFDPQLHEAVAQLASEGAPAGTVIEVYQRGYRQGDSVLRPARVVVAQ